ncbi:hypothetical protein PMIN01_08053 [Paraphaeosphaeria minitans]|uniref:Uncharacterized protein n=1 Tax=Paraphaeosphaeria minitans TaxID=565426 RepID=A0A9P6GES9_9PLEO|nr:hypothetical protein PMIN01_08053 [Paraphaeosphaeria minitans]
MSFMQNPPSRCQNCHDFGINAEKLRKLVGAFTALQNVLKNIQPMVNNIQPLINEIQPIVDQTWSPLIDQDHLFTGSGGEQSDIEHSDDSAFGANESEPLHCPHDKCKSESKTQTYTNISSLTRHFTTHVTCKETCMLCGKKIATVKKYLRHFNSCKRESNNGNLEEAKRKKAELSSMVRSKMRQMLPERTKPIKGGVLVGENSGKRNASDAGLTPQGRQINSRGMASPNSDACYNKAVAAGINGPHS